MGSDFALVAFLAAVSLIVVIDRAILLDRLCYEGIHICLLIERDSCTS